MYAIVDTARRLAVPEVIGRCPRCDQPVHARTGSIHTMHWEHVDGPECDAWSEPDTEWHLSWKRWVDADHTEVVIDRGSDRHRADVVCANGAVLVLRDRGMSSADIAAREGFFPRMAWLFRVSWADQIRRGAKGFWWKHGQLSQVSITKPLFWEFTDQGLVQEIKLGRAEESGRVLGRVVRTYKREHFAAFVATGTMEKSA